MFCIFFKDSFFICMEQDLLEKTAEWRRYADFIPCPYENELEVHAVNTAVRYWSELQETETY